MLPNVQADYQATDFVKVYVNVGAEYRNWEHDSSKSARNWAWMPQATVGVKATF
jgi:hypothetical protein